jgi:hypothetical protein
MLKGVLAAYGIILASIPIPVVHFVALPLSPFIAGFFGGSIAKADEGRILAFGSIVAGLLLVPAAVLLSVGLLAEGKIAGVDRWLVVSVAAALVPYAWFGVTMGALVSYIVRMREEKDSGDRRAHVSGS